MLGLWERRIEGRAKGMREMQSRTYPTPTPEET